MKSPGILRAVRALRFDRAIGDAPSLGRVERVWGTGRSKRKRRRNKDDVLSQDGALSPDVARGRRGTRSRRHRGRKWRRKVIMAWSLVLALAGLVTIGGALWMWGTDQQERAAEEAVLQGAAPVVETRVVSRFVSPTREAALALVKQALQIRDPGQIPECFRLGTATPEAVVGFLRDWEKTLGPITGYAWLSSMDANGLLLDGVAVNTKTADGEEHNRLAILTPDAKGKWQLDFDAFAQTVKPAWSELTTLPEGGQAMVRVVIAKDNYYNGPFRDETLWTCYRLGSAELERDLLGYCRKDSPQAAAMVRMLAQEKSTSKRRTVYRATLQLRRSEGAAARQFEISRVLAEDWVMADTPFDQQHK